MTYLLLLFLCLPLSTAIRCIDCVYNGTSKHCNEDCEGDVCGVWKWNDRDKQFIRQGCVSGIPSTSIGCRTNQVGASLCICNDFSLCNTEHRSVSTVPTLPLVRLPSVDCLSILHLHPSLTDSEDSPLQIESSHAKCHSDYCHFTRTESSLESRMANLSVSLCSPHPQYEFDVRIHEDSSLRGLHSNFCYSIKTSRHSRHIHCVCSTKLCNRNRVKTIEEGPIQCYTLDESTDAAKIDRESFCYGHLCFLRQSEEGRFTKGCLSLFPIGSVPTLILPGNRSIFGEKQWLCNDQLCNLNMDRLSRSQSKRVVPPLPPLSLTPLPVNAISHTSLLLSLTLMFSLSSLS